MEDPREPLIGTWRLAKVEHSSGRGEVDDQPWGTAPTGLLTYTSEGTMTALISYGGRRLLSADRLAAPAAERAEAFASFFAYGGRYSVDGLRVIHHVEVASFQNWVGSDLVREFELRDGRLRLRTPATLVGGEARIAELFWERA
jgi:lipocalin-like protein